MTAIRLVPFAFACIGVAVALTGCAERSGIDNGADTHPNGDDPGDGDPGETGANETDDGDPDTSDTDTSDTGSQDLAGSYLFALETSLGPDLPLQFVLDIDNVVGSDAGTTADFVFTPLSLDQGDTVPGECIGAPLEYQGVQIDADGNFDLDMGLVMITGAANPVTGSDITATMVQHGHLVDPDRMCGDVEGMLTSPLEYDLIGSTFAAIPLEGGCQADSFPTPIYDCYGAEAGVGSEIAGVYLIALETSLGSDLPLQFVLRIDNVGVTADGTTADFEFRPLSLDQGETLTPRVCLPELLTYSGVEIDADGDFELNMGLVVVSGEANPITGSEMQLISVLLGHIEDSDTMCGVVEGTLVSPVEFDLEGSTFAAVRLADLGCTPQNLPASFPFSCSMP
jgi:hypothetical protein